MMASEYSIVGLKGICTCKSERTIKLNYGEYVDFKNLTCNICDDDVENVNYCNLKIISILDKVLNLGDSKSIADSAIYIPINELDVEFKQLTMDMNFEEVVTRGYNNRLSFDAYAWKRNMDICAELTRDQRHILKEFYTKYFMDVGDDVKSCDPIDMNPVSSFLNNIEDPEILSMAENINSRWSTLCKESVKMASNQTSAVVLNRQFFVAGGRFRECYYWDCYWILIGLLISRMYDSAENLVRNFIDMINKFGFIPNGTRKYFLKRSQPPYFCSMLMALYIYNKDRFEDLVLNEGLDAATKEYKFFMNHKRIQAVDKKGETHILNRYNVYTNFPRIENFNGDVETYFNQMSLNATEVFSNLKSSAESGLDFTSKFDCSTKGASSQIPVDLNSILYGNERILENICRLKGSVEEADFFKSSRERRGIAINSLLWDSHEGVWADYDPVSKLHRKGYYFPNISPLMVGIAPVTGNHYNILSKYSKHLFGHPGGVPSSEFQSGEQWDFPNAWPPHQQQFVEYLLGIKEYDLALGVATRVFDSARGAFKNFRDFFEKYDVVKVGYSGAGGEYVPQSGFGWTNGMLLYIIDNFGDKLSRIDSVETHDELYENVKIYLKNRRTI